MDHTPRGPRDYRQALIIPAILNMPYPLSRVQTTDDSSSHLPTHGKRHGKGYVAPLPTPSDSSSSAQHASSLESASRTVKRTHPARINVRSCSSKGHQAFTASSRPRVCGDAPILSFHAPTEVRDATHILEARYVRKPLFDYTLFTHQKRQVRSWADSPSLELQHPSGHQHQRRATAVASPNPLHPPPSPGGELFLPQFPGPRNLHLPHWANHQPSGLLRSLRSDAGTARLLHPPGFRPPLLRLHGPG